MGSCSFNVYCGASRITLLGGDKAVIFPLKKEEYGEGGLTSYALATLPIFGEYDEYGGIENIERDFGTNIIEEVLECDIDRFCHNLTRGEIDRQDGRQGLSWKAIALMADFKYMWMRRDVYDFLSKYRRGTGDIDMGKDCILSMAGFKQMKEGEYKGDRGQQPGRYRLIYQLGDKYIASDGTWCHGIPGNISIFKVEDLKKFCPESNVEHLEGRDASTLYKVLSGKERREIYRRILGLPRYAFRDEDYDPLSLKYNQMIENDETSVAFFERCSEQLRLFSNMSLFSTRFEPNVCYLTPQCGEHKLHQPILEKFVEINGKVVEELSEEY